MLIGELAKAVGVSTQTLRFYERLDLLHPSGRSRAGYRQYDATALVAMKRIRAAQKLGFTLAEIRTLVQVSGGTPGPAEARAAALAKRVEIRRLIAHWRRMEKSIAQWLRACRCGSDRSCSFISEADTSTTTDGPPPH